MNQTMLKIESEGAVVFTVAKCRQELTHAANGNFARTISGEMIFTGDASCQKYRSTITGSDRLPPTFESLARGKRVRVHCLQSLAEQVQQGVQEVTLSRPPVPGRVEVLDTLRRPLPFTQSGERTIRLHEAAGGLVCYQPLLDMLVVDVHTQADTTQGSIQWTLVLEEV